MGVKWCACVLSRFSCVQLFATLWFVADPAPLSMGFSRQEYWSGLPCPPPGGLPNTGIEPTSLTSLASAGWFFTTSATWEAWEVVHHCGFSFHFPDDRWCWASFHMLTGHLFSCEGCIWIFLHIKNIKLSFYYWVVRSFFFFFNFLATSSLSYWEYFFPVCPLFLHKQSLLKDQKFYILIKSSLLTIFWFGFLLRFI